MCEIKVGQVFERNGWHRRKIIQEVKLDGQDKVVYKTSYKNNIDDSWSPYTLEAFRLCGYGHLRSWGKRVYPLDTEK